MYVAFVAIGVAVIAIVLGFYFFRASRSRTQLRYDVVVERIFATGSTAKITIDDKPVAEPHEVRLWLQPVGNTDITSRAFDDETALTLSLGAPLATTPTSGDTSLQCIGAPGDDRVMVPKQMFKCGSLIYASMIVDGEPRPKLHGGLADVDIIEFDVADAGKQSLVGLLRASPQMIFAAGSVVVAIIGGVLGLFAAAYETEEERAADVTRAVAEQMATAGAVIPLSADNPLLVEMIRKAVNDALSARGVEIGSGEGTPPP
jgi:hypothetical protein